MKGLRVSLSFLLLLLPVSIIHAQVTGTYFLAPYDSYGFDSINRGNLNVHFSVPVFSKPGRGGANFSYSLNYDGLVYSPVTSSGTTAWSPAPNWGWTDSTNALYGYITYNIQHGTCSTTSPTPPHIIIEGQTETYNDYTYHDNKGVPHGISFSVSTTGCSATPSTPNLSGTSGTYTLTDNSGLTIYENNGTFTVFTPGGSRSTVPVYSIFAGANRPAVQAATYTDTNGNQITALSNGNFTDTMGMTVLSVTGSSTPTSPEVFTYTDSNGATQTVTINYTAYNVQTGFGVTGISEYSASSVPLVSSIVYSADGSSYSFTYETTPGSSSTVTGRLASITLRTGGTISYTYTGANHGIQSDGTYSGLTRTTTDGSYAYTRSGITSTASQTQRADGFATANVDTSTYVLASGYFFESDHAFYQGAASGTPLVETKTCYNYTGTVACTSTSAPGSGALNVAEFVYHNGSLFDSLHQGYANGLLGTSTGDFGSTTYSYTTYTGADSVPIYRLGSMLAISTANQIVAKYTYGYDETPPTATSGLPQHVAVTTERGNLTSTHAWFNSTQHVDQTNTYDDAGQLLSQTDWNGNTTSYVYDTATDTLLTQTNYPASLTSYSSYDTNTGLLLWSTDANGITNKTNYAYDGLERPLSVTTPDGGYTSYTYTNPETTVQKVLQYGTSAYNTVTSVTDGYGRQSTVTQTDTFSGNEVTTYAYDNDGRLYSVTNPQRSTASSTDGTTYYHYDGASRPLSVLEADGSTLGFAYNGNILTFTDEQGKQRQLLTNQAGQILQVNEPTSAGAFTISTLYGYDAAGHVISVQQQGGGTSAQYRTRTFSYDWAGRFTGSTTPEQGTTSYTFLNAAGNLCSGSLSLPCTRTDNLGITTTYTYDALNRLTSRSYSDAVTAPVSIAYDQTSANGLTIAYGKGYRTSMSDASGNSTWSYDQVGRVKVEQRKNNAVTNTAYWSYNFDGTTSSMTDYAGNTVNYGYDGTGKLTGITDATTGVAYIGSALYAPPGALTSATLGNTVTLANQYNPRIQPTQLTASSSTAQLFGLSFSYGTPTYNNGTITAVTNQLNSARSAAFTYDQLNRLQTANSATIGTTSLWGYTYGYDNWGNLISMSPSTGITNSETSFSTSAPNNQLATIGYDGDGRTTTDNIGNIYTYDAEGRILSVNGYTYTYDGDGNRVEKASSGTGTLYWPDLNGNAAEETDLTGGTVVRNVYWNGTQIARQDASGNWWYYLHDQLGTPRMTLSATGTVANDVDFYPFGGQAYSSGSSSNLYGFTGYESDFESSSNYAVFRNESPSTGRFLRPDPYDGSYDQTNPQSLNRYSYVANDPLIYTDPSGLDFWFSGCYYHEWSTQSTLLSNGNVVGVSDGASGSVIVFCSSESSGNANVGGTVGGGDRGKAPSNGPQSINWKKVGSCLVDSTLKHYGLDALTAGSGALAIPISKSLVPPFRMIGEPTTNLLSVLGHYVEINVPRITIDGLASTNLLRIAGRANPYVAGALLAIDVGMISYDTYQCYQKQ